MKRLGLVLLAALLVFSLACTAKEGGALGDKLRGDLANGGTTAAENGASAGGETAPAENGDWDGENAPDAAAAPEGSGAETTSPGAGEPAEAAGGTEVPTAPIAPAVDYSGFDALAPAVREHAIAALEAGRAALVWFDPAEELVQGLDAIPCGEEWFGDLMVVALEPDTHLQVYQAEGVYNEYGILRWTEGIETERGKNVDLVADMTLQRGDWLLLDGAVDNNHRYPYFLRVETAKGTAEWCITRHLNTAYNTGVGLWYGTATDAVREYGSAELVRASHYAEYDYLDGVGNLYSVVFDVPTVRLDSDDADNINQEIAERYYAVIGETVEAMEAGVSLDTVRMDYVAYYCEEQDVLSVVLRTYSDWEWTDYAVYNLEVSTGKRLDNVDMILRRADALGVDPEWWMGAREAALAESFGYDFLKELLGPDQYGFIDQQWQKTLEDVNELTRFYMDDRGQLCMTAPVYSLAGADYYMHEILVG